MSVRRRLEKLEKLEASRITLSDVVSVVLTVLDIVAEEGGEETARRVAERMWRSEVYAMARLRALEEEMARAALFL